MLNGGGKTKKKLMEQSDISKNISGLLTAINEQNHNNIARYHKELYRIGKNAIPSIRNNIIQLHRINILTRYKFQQIVQLARVLHDIDEQSCKDVTIELVNEGLDRTTIGCLRGINEFTLNDYYHYKIAEINIYQLKALGEKEKIERRMQLWISRAANENIKDIDRIYIVKKMDKGVAGNFLPVFNVINLLWNRYCPFPDLSREYTLYHEIGHFIENHKGGFRDIEQEKEANDFADKIFYKHHSKFFKLLFR